MPLTVDCEIEQASPDIQVLADSKGDRLQKQMDAIQAKYGFPDVEDDW
jgi:hypothetical protein